MLPTRCHPPAVGRLVVNEIILAMADRAMVGCRAVELVKVHFQCARVRGLDALDATSGPLAVRPVRDRGGSEGAGAQRWTSHNPPRSVRKLGYFSARGMGTFFTFCITDGVRYRVRKQ